ncbi:DUF4232 domain-containing protein [Streptomyces sp. NPDC020983]|uniref:DUF4232 domain-containing protein n=1 Tax=Streptomyces sp. NPDC020983 TaxID=3365106 RepID=UPI0037A28461
MRSRSMPVVVLAAVVAGGTLAGCHSTSGTSHGHKSRKSRSLSHYGSGSQAGRTTARPASSASGTSTAGAACRGAQLAGSASPAGSGAAVVVLRNTGSSACTMYGFPGVDLTGKDGTVSAERSTLAPTTVRLAASGSASFTLHFTPATGDGSGVTFTSLSVTPPDGTARILVPLTLRLAAGETSDPVTVDPVMSA